VRASQLIAVAWLLGGSPMLARALPPQSESIAEQTQAKSGEQEQGKPAAEQSKFFSPEDGWFDISGFLDQKYGFLPIAIPITEPAVGYGLAGGVAFIDKPLGSAKAGLGRPDITFVGGLGTENGTQGVMAGDMRYWLDDRVQTLVAVIDAKVNLDFFGVGNDAALSDDPLSYTLAPKGAMAQAKLRLGETRTWAGLGFAYSATDVTFDAPAGTTGLPSFERTSTVAGLTPSLTLDTRDNFFTPTRGTYLDASVGLFDEALGSDDNFQRADLTALEFIPLTREFLLGLRGEVTASFGDAPFYMRPYIELRGAPKMRYQGDETALVEAELRWQFWNRWSAVGFAGTGQAWNDADAFDDKKSIVTGGTGFRYELAREYGLHVGLDVAVGPDSTAIYLQVGSAWARP
jgi:hypothetical protein